MALASVTKMYSSPLQFLTMPWATLWDKGAGLSASTALSVARKRWVSEATRPNPGKRESKASSRKRGKCLLSLGERGMTEL